MSDELKTWTFVGHWADDEIVVEYVLEGEVEDTRIDVGHWEQGLFAAAASGSTVEKAEQAMLREYDDRWVDDHCIEELENGDVCGESLDDGEGYDGRCGHHADLAEARGEYAHHDG